MMEIQYVKLKREKVGKCNLCRRTRPLTWDHVPPQGSLQPTAVEVRSVFAALTGNKAGFPPSESQNGVKYRTLCKSCNEFLGSKYDTVIKEFAKTVAGYLRSSLSLPNPIHHRTKPAAIVRGILGHLIAAKIQTDDALFDKEVAPCILDESQPVPSNIHVFYWLFPYDIVCTIRDVGIASLADRNDSIGYCQLLKYFPIAYLISDRTSYGDLPDLTTYRTASVNDEVEIPIILGPIRSVEWPEAVDDGKVMIGGQALVNSILATKRHHGKK
jgi:hypothetical protein